MTDDFEDFYLATVQRTYATARRVAGDPDIAQDATIDAYVAMLCQWPKRRDRFVADNQSYVIGIVVKKVADWYRAHNRLVPLPDEADLPSVDDAHADVVDRVALFKEVRRFLESCPVVSRSVGILHFLHDFTPSQTAEILGMNASTVRTHLARLRKRLRPLVERWLDEGRDWNG